MMLNEFKIDEDRVILSFKNRSEKAVIDLSDLPKLETFGIRKTLKEAIALRVSFRAGV